MDARSSTDVQALTVEGPGSGRGGGNRSVGRALAILELLADTERPMSLADIAKGLELPKSSALSLMRALSLRGFVLSDVGGRYCLGVRSFEVGASYLRSMTPVRAVEQELAYLTESLGATSHFAVLQDDEVVYLAKHDPPGNGPKLASSLGARLPAAITAVGKAQLAHRRGDVDTSGALADELEVVRIRGYAVDEGETALGIRCVAAPVFSDQGCCGAIGVSCLRQGGPRLEVMAQAVLRASGEASTRLGGHRQSSPAVSESGGSQDLARTLR